MIIDDLNFTQNPYTVLGVDPDSDDRTVREAFLSFSETEKESRPEIDRAYRLIRNKKARLRHSMLLPVPMEEEELFRTPHRITAVYRSPGFWYNAVTSLNSPVEDTTPPSLRN